MSTSNGRRHAGRERVVVITAAGRGAFTRDQLARLSQAGDVAVVARADPLALPELAELLDGATVAGVTPRSVPDLSRPALEALPASLRGISVFATGVDFVDLDAAEECGIAIAHLPDYSGTSVAEHTIALLLTLSRRVHLSRDRVLGRVPPTTSVRGWEVRGKTMGVVGTGRIGRRVIALAHALGMHVLATDRHLGGKELGELLAGSHVVSLHVPLVHGDPPLLGRAELAAMRPGAFLLNVSRPALVDEEAVIEAIASGRLGGYAVDDRIRDRAAAAGLIEEGRIVESDHTAWYSDEALERGLEAWVDNLVALAAGRRQNLATRFPAVAHG